MTNYHPEHWTPLWKIRTMLEAIMAYMPSDEPGIGSLKYTKEERQKIALKSRQYISPKFGPLIKHEEQILKHTEAKNKKKAALKAQQALKDAEKVKTPEKKPQKDTSGLEQSLKRTKTINELQNIDSAKKESISSQLEVENRLKTNFRTNDKPVINPVQIREQLQRRISSNKENGSTALPTIVIHKSTDPDNTLDENINLSINQFENLGLMNQFSDRSKKKLKQLLQRKQKIEKLQNEFNLLIEQHKVKLFENFGTIIDDTIEFIDCKNSIRYVEKAKPKPPSPPKTEPEIQEIDFKAVNFTPKGHENDSLDLNHITEADTTHRHTLDTVNSPENRVVDEVRELNLNDQELEDKEEIEDQIYALNKKMYLLDFLIVICILGVIAFSCYHLFES